MNAPQKNVSPVSGSTSFNEIIKRLSMYLQQLEDAELRSRDNLGNLPECGIYVFFEGNKPIYVGRTDRMRKRILEHGRLSSDSNSAPLAFKIARDRAQTAGLNVNAYRSQLDKDTQFRPFFRQEKERIAQMQVKVVRVDHPVEQALFEIYAALELGTPYNDFENH